MEYSINDLWSMSSNDIKNVTRLLESYTEDSSIKKSMIRLRLIKTYYNERLFDIQSMKLIEETNILLMIERLINDNHIDNLHNKNFISIIKICERLFDYQDYYQENTIVSYNFKNIKGYKMVRLIGSGSFSTTFKVQFESELYSLKEMSGSRDSETMFHNEIALLTTLKDVDNVVYMCDHFVVDRSFYLVLENLEQYLPLRNIKIHKDDSINAHILNQIINTVKKIHELGIVHRDLRLENIIVSSTNIVKVTDFGLSNTRNNICKSHSGTFSYIDPLQMLDNFDYTFESLIKSDIWSLGIIIFSYIYGNKPFDFFKKTILQYSKDQIEPYYSLGLTRLDNEPIKNLYYLHYQFTEPFCPEVANRLNLIDPAIKLENMLSRELESRFLI